MIIFLISEEHYYDVNAAYWRYSQAQKCLLDIWNAHAPFVFHLWDVDRMKHWRGSCPCICHWTRLEEGLGFLWKYQISQTLEGVEITALFFPLFLLECKEYLGTLVLNEDQAAERSRSTTTLAECGRLRHPSNKLNTHRLTNISPRVF